MLEGSAYLTQAGEVLGTAEYMAPEQALGRQADQRSDLYSLGIVVYQMVVGHTPFKADTPSATLMAHIHQPVPVPDGLDPAVMPRLEPVLMKALAKKPNDRYQSPDGLIKALESVLPGSEPKAVERQRASEAFLAELPTEAQPVEARSRPFVRPIVVGFLAVGVVALTVLGYVAFNGDDGDSFAVAKTQPEATVRTSPTVPSPATVAPSEARTAVPGPTATSLAQVTVAP
jgi:serine/threonine-protein kinase